MSKKASKQIVKIDFMCQLKNGTNRLFSIFNQGVVHPQKRYLHLFIKNEFGKAMYTAKCT